MSPDFQHSANHDAARKLHQQGTGSWFLASEQFANWKSAPATFLWLHGIAGCGKSVLCSSIIQNVMDEYASVDNVAVVYFYFSFQDQAKQKPEMMVRSLIWQLAKKVKPITCTLTALFTSSHGEQPSLNALLYVLEDMIRCFDQVYLFVDALDECNDRKDLMDILETAINWKCSTLHALVTGRRERDIESKLESFSVGSNFVPLESDVVNPDIKSYILQRMQKDENLSRWRQDQREEIELTLTNKAHGMYASSISCQSLHTKYTT